jgi:outer membrane protein assembly factor BamD
MILRLMARSALPARIGLADGIPLGRTMARCLLALGLVGGLGGCSSNSWNGQAEDLEKPFDPTTQSAEQLYSNGVDAMNAKNYQTAGRQFDMVEQTYPYSTWAVNSQLMQGFLFYQLNHYTDAIAALDRFIQLHPSHRDIAYAYYLRALSFYEQIADIKRDQRNTQDAIQALQEVVNRFPDSSYGRDAKLKIDLCRDHLAGKEMEIGRYYERQHLYTAAIGRFQRVVDDFQTTNHVPEALHRLTEIYLILGLPNEARRTAAVLGHNYPGSEWYEDSYNQLVSVGEISDEQAKQTAAERPGLLSRTWHSVF